MEEEELLSVEAGATNNEEALKMEEVAGPPTNDHEAAEATIHNEAAGAMIPA